MTKAQEIALLEKTIDAFGPDSYLGPWLAEIRTELMTAIQSDLPPSAPLPAEARQQARAIVTEATDRAAEILDHANRTRIMRVDETTREIGRLRIYAVQALEQSLKSLRS